MEIFALAFAAFLTGCTCTFIFLDRRFRSENLLLKKALTGANEKNIRYAQKLLEAREQIEMMNNGRLKSPLQITKKK